MADFTERYPDNVPGKYYVDTKCLICGLCEDLAPSNFRINDAGMYAFVFKQPTTPEEIAQCIHFLASADASFVAGTVLEATGGE